MTLDDAIAEIIDREGGFVDNPADRGGPTCWGITEAVARAEGYGGPMAALPRDLAARIYRQRYVITPHIDAIAERAPELAAELLDTAVNMGTGTAIGFLQRVLNALNRGGRDYPDVTLDRAVGPATLHALDAFIKLRGANGETVLLRAIEALKGERYLELAEQRPANEAFLYGWLANRMGA